MSDHQPPQSITVYGGHLAPVAPLQQVLALYQAKKDFISSVLREGLDFGTIPGANKPALLKPGAEKLSSFFGLCSHFEDVSHTEDWTGEAHAGEPFFYYRVRCILVNASGVKIATADGSCNSWETKYRYRQAQRSCPECGKNAIIKGKAEYGGGWLCFAKKGGCGAKFADNDTAITGQQIGQAKNPDPAELVNTILKMAQKRALVAAVLIGCGASDYFTQDVDDFITAEYEDVTPRKHEEKPKPAPEKPAAPPPASKQKRQPASADLRAAYGQKMATATALGIHAQPIPENATDAEIIAAGKLLAQQIETAQAQPSEGVWMPPAD